MSNHISELECFYAYSDAINPVDKSYYLHELKEMTKAGSKEAAEYIDTINKHSN